MAKRHPYGSCGTESPPCPQCDGVKPDNIKRQKFTQSLKVPLTPDEIADRADRAAHLVSSIKRKEDELKAVVKHHKSIIESDMVQLDQFSKEVRDKNTYRQVDCERQFDFNAGKYRVVRTDTGEITEERRLLESEKQMELPFPEPSDDEKAAAGNPGEKPRDIPPPTQGESWRAVPIAEALPDMGPKAKKFYELCEAQGLDTIGKLCDWKNAVPSRWWKDLGSGVGEATFDKLDDGIAAFLAKRAAEKKE